MTATTTSPEKQITLDTPDLKIPDDAKLKQEILDLKITGIDNDSNITPELLEKYTIWRRTNQKLDALKLGSSLSLAQFEEKLESNISGDEVASDAVKTAVEDATTAGVAASSEVTDAVVQAAKTNIFSSLDGWFEKFIAGLGLGSIGTLMTQNFSLSKEVSSWFEGTWIGKIFGINLPEVPENTDTPAPEDDASQTPPEKPTDTQKAPDENIAEAITENAPDIVYKTGALLLYNLNGDTSQFERKDGSTIFKNMSQLSYQDILDMGNNTSSILQDAGEDKQEYAADLLSSYQSEKTLTLLRVGLTGDAIQNLLFPNGKINTSLIELFGEERMNSIYQMAQKPDFDWKILRFQEVCMLYGLLLPTSKIPEIDGLGHISHNLKSFTGTGEVGNTLQGYTQISSSLMTGLSGLGLTLTKDEFISPDKDTDFMNQVRSHIPDGANKNNDIEVLSRIVAFKNNIISDGTENGFLSHPKLQLSPEQKKIIQENIGYTQVLALFSTLDGNSDLSSMNALSLPAVLYIISDILGNNGTENAFSSTQYLGNYLRKVLFGEMDANILSQDEKDVLGIYGEKAIELVYASYMQQYLSILGFSGGLTDVDLNQLALSSFIGGFALNTGGSFLVKSGIKNGKISIPGTFLKKIGWIGMILGAATGAVSFYTQSGNTGKFERDLQSSVENGDMEKFISLLKTHKESIKRYTTPNGKEVVALTFPGEPPFYVIDGIVYGIQAGRLDWDERIKNISQHEQGIWQGIIEYGSSVVGDGTGKVDGVDYTTQRFENEHIIFGTGDKTHTIAISQLLGLFETQPGKVGQDILSKITNGETVLPYGLGNEGIEGYPLAQLGNNDMLFLAKIGTIDQMFQT